MLDHQLVESYQEEQGREFYCRVLGLPEIEKPYEATMLLIQ